MSTNDNIERDDIKIENSKAQMRKGVLEMYSWNHRRRRAIHIRYHQQVKRK
jgi:hypothetical protein